MSNKLTKILHFPITKIVIGVIVCFGAMVLARNFVTKPIFHSLISQKNIADTIINYISFFQLLVSYYFLFKFYENRQVTELSLKRIGKEAVGGFLLGFSVIAIVIAIVFSMGYYSVTDIGSASYMLAPFSLLVLAAIIEDLFHRGLILRLVEGSLGTYVGLLVGILVEMQHLFNPNVNLTAIISYVIWGFTMSSLYIYTKRVWLPFFFHLGWNFSQPFFGSNLSGLDDMGYILRGKFEGPQFLTGGIYGIEASILPNVLLLTVGIVFFYLSIKRGKIIKQSLITKPGL